MCRIDGQLQEAALAHDLRELTELDGGSARFALKLSFWQTRFERGPCRQLLAGGLKIVGNALEKRRAPCE
ncbi:hypothetical protein D3C84_1115650 [compost metagenome]